MKRAALVAGLAAIVVSFGCAIDTEHRLASTFDASKAAVRRGELGEARALAERGLALAAKDSPWAWTFRLYRGEILLLQHEPADVLPLVREVPPAGAPFDGVRARQKYLEARLQLTQNHLTDALASLDAARRAGGATRDLRFEIDWFDGQLRLRLGKWAEGESRLNEVIAQAAAANDHYHEARALNDLGMGGVIRSRWDEALLRFERVLSFADLEHLTVYGEALTNAGICYARLGEFDRAVATQRRSIDLHEGRGPRIDFEHALGELGHTFMQRGDTRQALPYLRQALDVSNQSNLQADAAVWAGNLAAAHAELGEWDEAARVNDEAKRLKVASRAGNLVYTTLNAAQIAQGRGQLEEASRLFEETLANGAEVPSVRWSAYAGLAGVAIAARQPERAARSFEAALDTIEKTRSGLLKTDYKLTFMSQLIKFYQDYVDALVNEGRIERALEVSESSRGRVLAERSDLAPPARANASALQKVAAQSRSVLLSYWLGSVRSYVWIVTATGVKGLPLPPAKEIEALVRQYQTTLGSALADPLAASNTAGDRLYQILVEPLASSIPPNTRVIIVPDGALHGINFETLPVPGAKRHYWIEDVEVQTAPALSMLTAAAPGSIRARSLLLFGDPAPRPPEFPALKYAAAEIANVSKHFPADGVAAYQRDRASPAAYRTATPDRYGFVHFTAHAATNLESPLDSAVILTGPDYAYKLYARDVASMPLRADLVTVSACRSAGERAYSGEGLIGFAWAFLRAGASRVIAGLWDVDDRSTADLMDTLYARIAAGDAPARALRAAKLSLLAKGGGYGKPYYWGPFQIFTVIAD